MANIYVGNISFDATEESVKELFAEYGEVTRVSMIMDRETGRPRGFGFVEMADDQAAQSAIEALNGKELAGRSLTVNEARPKADRGGRGGGGGGYGGGGGRGRY